MPRRYATDEEALEARRTSQREATKRYLASDRGRAKRAEINARYINSERGRATRQLCRQRERSRCETVVIEATVE